jgi:hypothetical protein
MRGVIDKFGLRLRNFLFLSPLSFFDPNLTLLPTDRTIPAYTPFSPSNYLFISPRRSCSDLCLADIGHG